MYLKKKTRTRLIILLAIVFAIILWRGIKSTTKDVYDCQFKVIYAICTAKVKNAEMPGIWDILKAGTKFKS